LQFQLTDHKLFFKSVGLFFAHNLLINRKKETRTLFLMNNSG
jgi:hypothetical protein